MINKGRTKNIPTEMTNIVIEINNNIKQPGEIISDFIDLHSKRLGDNIDKQLDDEFYISECLRDSILLFSGGCREPIKYENIDLLDMLCVINEKNNRYKDILNERISNCPNNALLIAINERDKTEIISHLMIDELDLFFTTYEFAYIRYTTRFYNHNEQSLVQMKGFFESLGWDDDIYKEITTLNNDEKEILDIIRNIIVKKIWLEKEVVKIIFGELSNDIFKHIIKFR